MKEFLKDNMWYLIGGFVGLVVLVIAFAANAAEVDDKINAAMADGCVDVTETASIEGLMGASAVRPMSDIEAKKAEKRMNFDPTQGGTVKPYVSFFPKEKMVRIIGFNGNGCVMGMVGIPMNLAAMFLDKVE